MPESEMNCMIKSFLPTLRNVAILWLISKEASHGYSIIKKFREFAPPGLSVTESRVYPGLNDLERKGYLKSEIDTTISNERPRKVYSITKKGKNYLSDEVDQIYEIVKYINGFLIQMKNDMDRSMGYCSYNRNDM